MALEGLEMQTLTLLPKVGNIGLCTDCPKGRVREYPDGTTFTNKVYCSNPQCPNRHPDCVIFDPDFGLWWPKE